MADERLLNLLCQQVAARMSARADTAPTSWSDERKAAETIARELLQRMAHQEVAAARPPMPRQEENELIEAVVAHIGGLGRIEALLNDPRVENIDANGADTVWIEYDDGSRARGPALADSDEALIELVRRLAAGAGGGVTRRAFDSANPLLTVRLPDGSRLNAIVAVAPFPCVSIRRHRLVDVTLDDLVARGTLNDPLCRFLRAAVRARCNLLIAGGTNTGKTTLLRALLAEVPADERLFVIERAAELDLHRHGDRHGNVVPLEERLPNLEQRGAVPMAALVQQSLGMNPSRVIVGEILGPEIMNMLHAMTQGNDGSICTVHARSNRHVIARLHAYAARADERPEPHTVDALIAGGLDFLVFLEARTVRGVRKRMVTNIAEVTGQRAPALSDVFVSRGDEPATETGVAMQRISQLVSAGFHPGQTGALR